MFDVSLGKVIGPHSGALQVSYSSRGAVLKAVSDKRNVVVVYNEVPSKYPALAVAGKCRKIGLCFAETESIPSDWRSPLFNMDEVWTASHFNKKAFIYAGIPEEMIRVMPLGLDGNLYDPDKVGRSMYYDPDVFTFLMVISNFNRKDVQDVIRAYSLAFQDVKLVNLLLKIPKNSTAENYKKFILEPMEECAGHFSRIPPITIIKNYFSDEYMNRLYNTADCYLAIERAKGWDLPAFQSMALGKPVIGLNWSANTEFMSHENSLLIEPNETLIYADSSLAENLSLYAGHKWASYDFDQLVHYMRDVYAHPDRYAPKARAARKSILADYSLEKTGARMKDIIGAYRSFEFASNHPARVTVSKNPANAPKGASPYLGPLPRFRIDRYFNGTGLLPLRKLKKRYASVKEVLQTDPAKSNALNKRLSEFFIPQKVLSTLKMAAAHLGCKRYFNREYGRVLHLAKGRSKPYHPSQSLDDWVQVQREAEDLLGPEPTTSEEQARLASVQNGYQGKRIFVLGNGPSLNRIDFEKLKNEYSFGCNKIYLKYDASDWRPTFYTALDWRVTPDSYREINEKTTDSICFFPKRFFGLLRNDEKTYWYATRVNSAACEDNFSLDISRGVAGFGTVIYSALQIACHLGFRDIYLLGVDVDYKIQDTVQQSGADKFHTGTKINLTSTRDDDINHFDPRYFGKGAKWHDPNVDEMIRGFMLIRKLLANTGINVYNATPGGQLEVFERVDFDSLF